jgi:hypothetical protein
MRNQWLWKNKNLMDLFEKLTNQDKWVFFFWNFLTVFKMWLFAGSNSTLIPPILIIKTTHAGEFFELSLINRI